MGYQHLDNSPNDTFDPHAVAKSLQSYVGVGFVCDIGVDESWIGCFEI